MCTSRVGWLCPDSPVKLQAAGDQGLKVPTKAALIAHTPVDYQIVQKSVKAHLQQSMQKTNVKEPPPQEESTRRAGAATAVQEVSVGSQRMLRTKYSPCPTNLQK